MRLALAALLLLSGCAAGPPQDAPAPPSFVIVIADDLGWRDVGWHGSEIKTPHLDRLSGEGVRLERHYVYPTCSPTRAGILTGRNPSRFEISGPIGGRSEQVLPAEAMTLARALRDRGYATGLSGKWHLGLRPESGPRRYGFDRSYGYLHGQIDPYTHLYKNGDRSWHRNDAFLDEEGHATDLIAAEAVRFVEANARKPFLLWVAFSVPHHPLQEPAEWTDPYKESIADPWRRLFAASVTHMDAAIGRIAAALEGSGIDRRTIFLFTSDNGGQKSYSSQTEYDGRYEPHLTLGDNRPLRGWKGQLYEGGVRVPSFVRWPGVLKPAALEAPVSLLDWFPTILARAGGTVDPAWKVEGRDVWPLLSGAGPAPPFRLHWETGGTAGIVEGDWKLIVPQRPAGAAELFDLAGDRKEEREVSAAQAARAEELRRALAGAKSR